MELGDYIIPEGWESMSCIYNCGFFLVWQHGTPEEKNVGMVMSGHLEGHGDDKASFLSWIWNRKGKNEGLR